MCEGLNITQRIYTFSIYYIGNTIKKYFSQKEEIADSKTYDHINTKK